MLDFTYYAPTKFFFGKGAHKNIGEIVKGYGFKKIMLQYGMGSVIKSGLLGEVKLSLEGCGIKYVELGGVQPNPTLSFVKKAIDIAKTEQVEMILAIGG